ncbi:hypothetical protein BDA99DRAFT_543006 [Phascolomyces articulosus]|uniref:Uncharacterized protein n=1 Tax=Phascolomyces articulosus TaxID=60185 RepID=A0AAD5P844_9FUNG|nr:hypothetical protein BDA99DRAFT_543006 [Phascolomyces articulosus]
MKDVLIHIDDIGKVYYISYGNDYRQASSMCSSFVWNIETEISVLALAHLLPMFCFYNSSSVYIVFAYDITAQFFLALSTTVTYRWLLFQCWVLLSSIRVIVVCGELICLIMAPVTCEGTII